MVKWPSLLLLLIVVVIVTASAKEDDRRKRQDDSDSGKQEEGQIIPESEEQEEGQIIPDSDEQAEGEIIPDSEDLDEGFKVPDYYAQETETATEMTTDTTTEGSTTMRWWMTTTEVYDPKDWVKMLNFTKLPPDNLDIVYRIELEFDRFKFMHDKPLELYHKCAMAESNYPILRNMARRGFAERFLRTLAPTRPCANTVQVQFNEIVNENVLRIMRNMHKKLYFADFDVAGYAGCNITLEAAIEQMNEVDYYFDPAAKPIPPKRNCSDLENEMLNATLDPGQCDVNRYTKPTTTTTTTTTTSTPTTTTEETTEATPEAEPVSAANALGVMISVIMIISV